MQKLIISLLAIIFMSSCSKDETQIVIQENVIQNLKSVIKDDKEIENYEYYSDNSLKNLFRSDQDGTFRYQYHFTYNDSANVEHRYDTVDNILIGSRRYYWTQDSIGVVDIVTNLGVVADSYFYYFRDNCGNTEQTYNSFDVKTEYLDENCSSISVVEFFSGDNTYTEEFTRSEKRGVSIDIPTNCFGIKQLNAVTRYKMQREGSSSSYIYNAEFEFNEFGNIVKETRTIENGDINIYKYDYY